MQRIALFFGSFNPIHVGHLIIAQTLLQHDGVDEVWLVVSPHNPHKAAAELAAEEHRLAMAQIATAGNEGLRVCDIEMQLPRPSYTVLTLDALQRQYPQHEFSLIMGGDNLASLPRWRDYRRIIDEHRIFVYPRPGYEDAALARHSHVTVVEVPTMQLSSTYLRQQVAQGRSLRYLTPEGVRHYIEEHGLYGKNENKTMD